MSDIIKEILGREDEILSKIDPESIEVYLFLKNEYAKGDIENNAIFQFVFRSYYRLDGAGLGDDLKTAFFKLLGHKEDNLEKILRKLHDIRTLRNKNTVQFSFATKLLHTLDEENPIFDSRVTKVIRKPVTGASGDDRINSSIGFYKDLKSIYDDLLEESEIKKVILKFRKKFDVNPKQVSDSKVLDFIIWTLGKLKIEDKEEESSHR